jgi:MoxR-like ATPase
VVQGRDYVTPADVKEMAPLVLPHRLVLKAESEMSGQTAAGVLADVLDTVPIELGNPA